MSIAVPFPEELPEGYQWLSDEPPFDPERHLSLESPSQTPYTGRSWLFPGRDPGQGDKLWCFRTFQDSFHGRFGGHAGNSTEAEDL